MDFFGTQTQTRRRSRGLILLFLIALVAMGACLHLSVTGVAWLFGVVPSMFTPTAPVRAMIVLLWIGVLLGCLFRWLDVRGGGERLARRLGAVPWQDTARTLGERLPPLADVVAEMAVASGRPAPAVYVLTRETSVNALVLGHEAGDAVLVVTQGALQALDRDQLQAVVAHEFGHLASDDTRVNMRLLVALGGLHALDEIGRLWQRRADARHVHPGVLLGGALRLFASIGVLIGNLLRAAVSRQREFLADARAVEFTRNPAALVSALALLADIRDAVPLHDHRAAEFAHLCFSGGIVAWWQRALASHPPLEARIHAIDPQHVIRAHVRARQRRRTASRADDRGDR